MYNRKNIYLCAMIHQDELYQLSNPDIIVMLGKRFKQYRLALRMTQQDVALKAGLSLVTVRQFETGKALNITMGTFLALLRTIEQLHEINQLLPEIPISPYVLSKIQEKQPKRIRHAK